MEKGIFRCMDFDTNHPKLIIAAVACNRNGLTNEAAAFSVRLSAFFIRRTPAVHKTVAFRLTRSRRFALLIQKRKFHFSRFRIFYFSVILSPIPWLFKGIVLTAGKQSHTRVLFKI